MTVPGKGGRPLLGDENDPSCRAHFTLLESQVEWLNRQPGGASAKVRALIDRAMKREKRNR